MAGRLWIIKDSELKENGLTEAVKERDTEKIGCSTRYR